MIQINAQTSIQGKTIDVDTGEILIATNISFYQNDILIWETQSDRNGNYSVNLDPGNYDDLFYYVGYTGSAIYNLIINTNQITKLDWGLSAGIGICFSSIIFDYRPPIRSNYSGSYLQ